MINNFYLTKDDLFVSENSNKDELFTTNNNSVLNKILGGANSIDNPVDTIKAIEKYNKDNNLDYNERLKYSLYVGDHFLAVAEGTFSPDGKTFICLSYDATGAVFYEYGEGKDAKQLKNASSIFSTHYIPINMIVDVIIKGYNDQDSYFKDYENIKPTTEDTLTMKLTNLLSSMNSFISAGMYKSAINKFSIEFKNNNLNDMNTYKFNQKAYNQYVVVFDKYLSIIKSVLSNYNESIKNHETKSRIGMYFVDCKFTDKEKKESKDKKFNDTINTLIASLRDKNINDGFIDPALLKERIFDISEIKTFKTILGLDEKPAKKQ